MPRDSSNPLSILELREELRHRADTAPAHRRILIETDGAFDGVSLTEAGELQLGEDGSIADVAVLRENSRNNRSYKAAMNEKTARIFEGKTVYLNHPDEGKNHRVEEIAAKLEGVYVAKSKNGESILRARKLTPIGAGKAALIETVKTAHDRAGLSIEAVGVGEVDKDGKFHVTEITRAYGVALVANPGTTTNLFESVISDKIESDEKLEGLRKIVSAANQMMSEVVDPYYSQSRDMTLQQRLDKCRSVAAALVAELADFKITQRTNESDMSDLDEEQVMKPEEIKKLTAKELREHAPDLVMELVKETAKAPGAEQVASLKRELEEQTAKTRKLEEADAARKRAEANRRTAQGLLEKVVKAKSVPAHIVTPKLIRACTEADFSRFETDGKLDEAAVEAFITEEIDDRMAIAGPVSGIPAVRIIESTVPFSNADKKSPCESITDEQLAALCR